MTQTEAKQECARPTAEHPDRATHQWRPIGQAGGPWQVAKIAIPPKNEELKAETQADERPPTGEDPRSAAFKNLGPNVGPGF